jgi:large subunit ribosomal protein L7/L12
LIEQVGALDTESKAEFFERSLGQLTVGECLSLVKRLEQEWEVEATPNFGNVPKQDEAEEDVEQTEFAVNLTSFGQKKIAVIKAVRTLTGQNLKEAKGVVDKTPVVIQENLSKEDAEKAKAALEEAGATVELR